MKKSLSLVLVLVLLFATIFFLNLKEDVILREGFGIKVQSFLNSEYSIGDNVNLKINVSNQGTSKVENARLYIKHSEMISNKNQYLSESFELNPRTKENPKIKTKNFDFDFSVLGPDNEIPFLISINSYVQWNLFFKYITEQSLNFCYNERSKNCFPNVNDFKFDYEGYPVIVDKIKLVKDNNLNYNLLLDFNNLAKASIYDYDYSYEGDSFNPNSLGIIKDIYVKINGKEISCENKLNYYVKKQIVCKLSASDLEKKNELDLSFRYSYLMQGVEKIKIMLNE